MKKHAIQKAGAHDVSVWLSNLWVIFACILGKRFSFLSANLSNLSASHALFTCSFLFLLSFSLLLPPTVAQAVGDWFCCILHMFAHGAYSPHVLSKLCFSLSYQLYHLCFFFSYLEVPSKYKVTWAHSRMSLYVNASLSQCLFLCLIRVKAAMRSFISQAYRILIDCFALLQVPVMMQ